MFPLVLGIVNLFFCGYSDQYMRSDASGHYLCLFFFLEASVCWALSLAVLIQQGRDVLGKTKVYPVPAWSRMMFALWVGFSGSLFRTLWMTASLFLVVLYFNQPVMMIAALLFFTLLMANAVVVASFFLVLSVRSSSSGGAPVLAIAFSGGAVLLLTLFFRIPDVLVYTPGAAWAAAGVIAAAGGHTLASLGNGLLLIGTLAGFTLAGWKAA
jgi:hypothetical protein